MKIKLEEFPNQPGRLPCCGECKGNAKKDCSSNPMKCIDFYIHNKTFIDNKLKEGVKL